MTDHLSIFDFDVHPGTYAISVSCSCGWSTAPYPGWWDAADAWGDHRADTASRNVVAGWAGVVVGWENRTDGDPSPVARVRVTATPDGPPLPLVDQTVAIFPGSMS